MHKDLRADIHNIYDEIVDTFHNYNKEHLSQSFSTETFKANEEGISLNPILHSFRITVNKIDMFIKPNTCH
ncbi:MAG: hypothetical protein ABJA79_11665 [Parafilimonas sp.]